VRPEVIPHWHQNPGGVGPDHAAGHIEHHHVMKMWNIELNILFTHNLDIQIVEV
jgi:hypothetical protein